MNNQSLIILKNKTQSYWYSIKPRIKIVAVRAAFVMLLFILMSNQEISFHIHIGAPTVVTNYSEDQNQGAIMNASLVEVPKKWWQQIKAEKNDIRTELNLANAATAVGAALSPAEQEAAAKYSNLGFVLNPSYAIKKGIDPKIVAFKTQKCYDYIELYLSTAKEEANLYGIPVAITLAQGLLESNAGDSKLAKNDNNHFGIKCKSKCVGCRCANYTDDSKYDMFRVFDSAWYSFREHSNLLMGSRYKHLTKLAKTEYKNWAHGLEAAGYATDKQYAEKLIKIIEALHLQQFDK
ncbi:glucosaminidase domain-containing protein [Aureispira anguillae]|uniref:Glucosaminidase domain-containing protein n=1 Tax=Aureispira anguillae TaxID=2864201 RepID=A0A915YLV9_9BACT|nr:glucosaminidase domain-containing protein [Aureispira anguillae]BDS15613.1 glucosaminidase domain-containing protein [Aureispira anguillae]